MALAQVDCRDSNPLGPVGGDPFNINSLGHSGQKENGRCGKYHWLWVRPQGKCWCQLVLGRLHIIFISLLTPPDHPHLLLNQSFTKHTSVCDGILAMITWFQNIGDLKVSKLSQ